MEERPRRLTRRLATALVVLALAGGWAANARADVAYGFASQTISNFTITGAVNPTSTGTPSTQALTTVNGSGTTNSGGLEVPQNYVGGTPASSDNNFGRYAPGNPPVSLVTNPVSGDFTRSDARLSATPPAVSTLQVVAESYVNTTVGKSETAGSSLSAGILFTAPSTGGVTISYTVFSDLFTFTQGTSANASANYHFDITVRDPLAPSNAAPVFTSNTAITNASLTSPPPSTEVIQNGTASGPITVTGLTGGTAYVMTLSLSAQSAVTAVPEPNVVMLVGASGGLTLAVGAIRRRTKKRVTK